MTPPTASPSPASPIQSAAAAIAADATHRDPAIWITRLPDADILAAARTLETEGPRDRPLWGVPFAIKDNIDVAGLPTTAACPAFAYTPEKSAPAVQRLLDAGALLIGKTNLDQFATGLSGVRSPYGIPRNLFDPQRVPGGSSSGSACAVGAGIVPFALGTDTAGSGRVPAMFANVIGYKPTIGSLAATGVVPACRSIDTISIFARTVDEALAVARIATAYDDADPYARTPPYPHLRRAAAYGRIGIASTLPPCDAAVASAYAAAAALFEIAPIDLAPFLEIARLLYAGPWVAERTAALRHFTDAHPDQLHPATRAILQSGHDRAAIDAFDAFHALAHARRAAQRIFADIDAVLVPTAPFCPTLDACAADPIGPNARLGAFTNFVNLCDMAAIAVPAGFGPNGDPVGVTILGPAWSEGRLAAIADRIHRTFADRVGATAQPLPPAACPDPLAPDETALFCVGAHMAGLPLNHQLRDRGARHLRDAETTPAYRLYALGPRPGLIRAAGGAAIQGEVWALPTHQIGSLLALVPPPLGFGTVDLAEGPCLGFLAEPAAMDAAIDITHHRAWRAWLNRRDA